MTKSLGKIHFVDVESTCWEENKPPSPSGKCRPNEIIEIGISRLILETMEIDKVEQYYAYPIWHPTLSKFCIELTGITQNVIDKAPPYPKVIAQMVSDFGKNALDSNLWTSWGDYDRTMFKHMQNEVWQNFPQPKDLYPWGYQHLNLKVLHGILIGAKKAMGISRALATMRMKFEGDPHCGRDDSFNIARIGRKIIKANTSINWQS